MQNCHDEHASNTKSCHKENKTQNNTTSTAGIVKISMNPIRAAAAESNAKMAWIDKKSDSGLIFFADLDGGLEDLAEHNLNEVISLLFAVTVTDGGGHGERVFRSFVGAV